MGGEIFFLYKEFHLHTLITDFIFLSSSEANTMLSFQSIKNIYSLFFCFFSTLN